MQRQNGLALQPHVVVDYQKEYLWDRGSIGETRGPGPIPSPQSKVPMPGRGSPAISAVKVSKNCTELGEIEDCSKSGHPLKGLIHRLTHSQALTLHAGRGMVTQEV